MSPLAWLSARAQAWRRRAQRRDLRARLLRAWARLDAMQGEMRRARAGYGRGLGRRGRRRVALRDGLGQLQGVLQAYQRGVAVLEAEAVAQRAQEVAASSFGQLDGLAKP